MKYISERIHVLYVSSLFTNGYYLDKYIDDINILNLEMIYLIIDGLPEMHNSIRYSKNDSNTFTKILSNIYKVIEKYPGINIVVKTNLKKGADFEFNKYLSLFKGLEGKIRLNPGCIIEKKEKSYIDYSLLYYKDLLKNGFAIYKLPWKKLEGGCPSYNKDSFAISSNGIIHKCIEGIGTDNFIIGNTNRGVFDVDSNRIMNIQNFNIFNNMHCTECVIFPYCMGGCLQEQLFSEAKCKYFKKRLIRAKAMVSHYYNQATIIK